MGVELLMEGQRPSEENSPVADARLRYLAGNAEVFAAVGHPKFPWRARCSPYRVLLAESCLKRTGATQATSVFLGLTTRYPSLASLRRAYPDDLAALLEPLGLRHRAATFLKCVSKIGRSVPRDESTLLTLPGVGPYVARAILCFAHGEPVGVLDVNVARVLSRYLLGVEPEGRPTSRRDLWELSDGVSRAANSPAMAQWGLIDIGRTICRKLPKCQRCPLNEMCRYCLDTRTSAD